MKITTIDENDGLTARTITIEENSFGNTFLTVAREGSVGVTANLTYEGTKAKDKLIKALAGENSTVVTDLPEVTVDRHGYVETERTSRHESSNPEDILTLAKSLLAIHAFLVKRNEEQEAAKIAEEEAAQAKDRARDKRRDELASELVGIFCTYRSRIQTLKDAIDRIIDLEEAAKVS